MSVPIATDPALSPATQQQLTQLRAIDTFALGGVGFAGSTSDGERLTRAIATQPDAIPALESLAHRDAPVAQLYAYWALRTLAPDRAIALAQHLANDTRAVRIMSGCTIREAPISAALTHADQRAKL